MQNSLKHNPITPSEWKDPGKIHQWRMVKIGQPFEPVITDMPELKSGEVLVQVAGCGVCHTDISFWHHGVQTRHPLPLTLGHEISGRIVAGDESLIGKPVIVPAVLPCGECELCRSGRSNICRKQRMPGNDFHGGFASHLVVPSRFLCIVPESLLGHYPLEYLAVVADAVSTPYQVIGRAELVQGDLAIVIGVGGVGSYGAQIARLKGARVLALDISDQRLQAASSAGAEATLNTSGMDLKAIRERLKEIVKTCGFPSHGWKIFEFSGTKAGQELGFSLLTYASTMSVVGFTMDKTEVRLSNLMAFDAKLIGTWGCRAELYPEVLELIGPGKIDITQSVELFPLSKINEVFNNTLHHKYSRRSVLVPGKDI